MSTTSDLVAGRSCTNDLTCRVIGECGGVLDKSDESQVLHICEEVSLKSGIFVINDVPYDTSIGEHKHLKDEQPFSCDKMSGAWDPYLLQSISCIWLRYMGTHRMQ